MSQYAYQILSSLKQHNEMYKEASETQEIIQESTQESPRQEGLSHMEKLAFLPALAIPWLAGLGGAGAVAAGGYGINRLVNRLRGEKTTAYNDLIPFNEPNPGEEGYDPYQAWAGNDWSRKSIADFHSKFGPQGHQTMEWNRPYGPGQYDYGQFGPPRFNRRQMRQQRRFARDQRLRSNPNNYMPGGKFIENKDKRKAWRQSLKDFRQNKPWKNPAPAAPAPAAPAAPVAPGEVAANL